VTEPLGDEAHPKLEGIIVETEFQQLTIGDFTAGQKMVLSGFIYQYWDAIRLGFPMKELMLVRERINKYYELYSKQGGSNRKYDIAVDLMNADYLVRGENG
jgi:hypothetical protein